MLSAPNEKPVSTSIVRNIPSASPSGEKKCFKMINKPPKPNTASPDTPSPITAPPVNETFKALLKLVFAASAVRTLALVATFMPI